MYRYEKKFSTSENNLDQIFSLINIHPAGFSEIYQERNINSIYFDSSDFKMHNDSTNGSLNRKKFRIRWYGYEKRLDSFLEIKKKEGNRGSKDRFQLNSFLNSEKITRNFLENLMEESNIPKIYISNLLNNYFPILMCSYNRRYFISLNKSIRLTIDYKIGYSFFSYNYSIKNAKRIYQSSVVLEYKYNYFIDEGSLINQDILPLRESRFSKYSNGIETLYL